jgi:class 3 adenylate cyclase/tetratricopeptide (TPR) repeat protein
VICPNCSTVNEAGRKFCLECGTPLKAGCPNCGAQNSPNAKFCGECGTNLANGTGAGSVAAVAPKVESASGPTSERRLVSVLFADLVGFTTMSQDEDPEDTREFLTRYFDLARTIVDRYGGTIEKFIGDAVMAVWGTPTTHEDDAERAVRAALELVDGVPGISDTRAVQARAGVLTGHAAVTIGASGQGMVAGDLVNTASRLQSVAPPGAVLVGEATFHATEGAIRFEEAGDQLLKGKASPVPAWRAAAVIGLRGGTGRNEALEPPFTGRDEELRLLKDMFHATEREQKARLVSVIGQGGIGKSRVAWEFEKYIDGVAGTVYWHHGRSPAYGDGISYWALAEMVRGRAGIAETDDGSVARARLHEAVVEWLPDDQEREWVEPRLAGLLALDAMPSGTRDELFAAWRTFFERVAARGPTILVFEDIQWADDGMLDFVTELLDRSRSLPIFAVALTRPELYDRRPGWGSNLRSLTTMTLEPLDAAQMEELVTGTVPGIPAAAVDAIVGRAEGIPLYAVETIRMLVDRGSLRRSSEGTYEIAGGLDDLAVPNSLQALIAARLDALGERERRLIQSAAIMGKSFTVESLAAISGDPAETLTELLATLVRRQMLLVDVDPRSPERGQYQFVQAVVREVAESSLSRADRRSLHLAAARYYEALGDDELAGVQASHYVEAHKATPPGPEADALAAQARVSLRAAAERAISLHSYRQALSYLDQALSVTPDPVEQAAIHERATGPAAEDGQFDVAVEHAKAMEALARQTGDRLAVLHAVTRRAWVEHSSHNERAALSLLEPALKEVADLPSSVEIVEARSEMARALMMAGEYERSIQLCDLALASSPLVSDYVVTELVITKGTAMANSLDRAVEGEILLRGAMEVAEQNNEFWLALRARNNMLGNVSGDDAALAYQMMVDGYAIAVSHGMSTWAFQFAHHARGSSLELGDWDAWASVVDELDATGFYGGWRVSEKAVRDGLRGSPEKARSGLEESRRLVGTESTQAIAGMDAAEAIVEFAVQDWVRMFEVAQRSWLIADSFDYAAGEVAAGISAAGEPEWARIQLNKFAEFAMRGIQQSGQRAGLETILAMLEGRWSDARASFRDAQRDLSASHYNLQLALFQLAVGTRGAGHMPEATDALTAAREFFAKVGATSLVDNYQMAMVEPERPARAATDAVPNAAR